MVCKSTQGQVSLYLVYAVELLDLLRGLFSVTLLVVIGIFQLRANGKVSW